MFNILHTERMDYEGSSTFETALEAGLEMNTYDHLDNEGHGLQVDAYPQDDPSTSDSEDSEGEVVQGEDHRLRLGPFVKYVATCMALAPQYTI
jgi:hypothetical protein